MDPRIGEWIRKAVDDRIADEGAGSGERVLPEAAFSDADQTDPGTAPGERGPAAPALRGLIAGSCCGWTRTPTARELYDAFRATEPDDRQRALLNTATNEMSLDDIARALRQGAFTLREFARAARMSTNAKRMKWKWLNRWAEKTAEG